MIAARQIAFGKAAGGNKLPDGVVPIEYLEFNKQGSSSFYQYINTGVKTSDPSQVKIEVVADTVFPCGFMHNNKATGIWVCMFTVSSTGLVRVYHGNYKSVKTITPPATITSCVFDGGSGMYINGTLYEQFTVSNEVGSIADFPWLFGTLYDFNIPGPNNSTTRVSVGKLYALRFYVGGVIVFDGIPVRKGNIGYMYDRVSGQLFGNQGTGEFVLGSDIIDYTAKDYIQDGLVAMWDGIENAGWGKHDPNATVWVDLVGNLDATAIDSPIFGDNYTDTSNGYWSLPSSVREIVEAQNLTAEVVFQPSGANISNQGIVGIGENRSLWLFLGNPPLSSTATLSWQVRSSSGIRVWRNNGVFGTDAHSSTVVNNNSVCNAYLDSDICTITPDVIAGNAVSSSEYYLGRMASYNKFYGKIHSVRLYNRALTAEEIAHNYEIDKARFGL